jgi:hypothetical protein
MTITPRGFEAGFHDRRKIFSPPVPSKVSSFTALTGLRRSPHMKKIKMMSGSWVVNRTHMESLAHQKACLIFQQGCMLRAQVDSILRHALSSVSVGYG